MRFLDCNCCFGRPSKPTPSPAACPTVEDLIAQIERAGIERAVAWHIAQHDVSPQRGNEMLAEAIRGHSNLLGCWTLLPNQTGEMPVDELLSGMKEARIVALRAFPGPHRYLLNRLTLGPLLDAMVERRIPLIVSMKRGVTWPEVYALLAEVPDLTLLIVDHGSWGCDRFFRPLFENYERVHVDTTLYFLDGGIEDVVRTYGPGRLLFGSGLPERSPGGTMMYLRHCEIDDEQKAAIAGGNLRRLLEEVKL
jgi:predicted TIM-barrel fold metal-dependent hydrolase